MTFAGSSHPLGNLEVFFKKLAELWAPLGREHWAVHLCLTLRISNSTVNLVPYLQRTWQTVLHQYPAIGSIIGPARENQPESNTSAQELLIIPALDATIWTSNTFFVHEHEIDAGNLFSALRPTPRATCHWLPKSSELVIRSSHWRLDGIGMTKLGHVFLATLAEMLAMKKGRLPSDVSTAGASATQQLPSSLEEVARIWRNKQELDGPTTLEQRKNHSIRLAAGADALVGEFLRGVPSVGLPTRPDSTTTPPGASSRIEIRIDTLTTTKVSEACRVKSFSFTGAVHAAIVCVTAQYPQHSLAKSYAAFFPVDLRRSLISAGAAEEDQLMFGLYFSGLPICVEGVVPEEGEMAKSFEQVAREMTTVYNKDLTAFWEAPDGHQVSLMELAEPYVQRTTALFDAPVPAGLPPVQTPDLSGLGRVEIYLNNEYQSQSDSLAPKVEVSDMWIGTERLDKCVQFHVWSWRDELRLGASFNESFYEKSAVTNFLGQILEELLNGLDVRNNS